MAYRVLFESTLPEDSTREVVRVLESLPLRVVPVGGPSGESRSCASIPVVTLGECPTRLESLGELGPRGWIAILPAEEGSTARFLEAGAFAALRLPIERSVLLSTVSRCLCIAGAAAPGLRHRARPTRASAREHASLG